MTSKLPLPPEQLHYADPAVNDEAQACAIRVLIDRIHYPTLGCPALLTPDRALEVVLSFPEADDPAKVKVKLIDRHGGGGEYPLEPVAAPEPLGLGPPSGKTGRRQAWRMRYAALTLPRRLFDLRAEWFGGGETQHNAVRLYEQISGNEKVVLCGDTQYHVLNRVCLERFIDRINARDDVAWIALIGDVCDNRVTGTYHMLKTAMFAKPGDVVCHYTDEFHQAAVDLLPRLNKPIRLMPGNHDGMAAYERYEKGTSTDVYVGPDPANKLAYDGFHHYRRALGPLYHSFDWGDTRWLCLNSFELDRHDRLGYHAIVANWGGAMRSEQLGWVRRELEEATARGMRTVVLLHHDPRGGSLGSELGYYHPIRAYDYAGLRRIVVDYIKYLAHNTSRWQQEWMGSKDGDLARHPVKELLALLLEHKVWGVFMGHDNENWVESYFKGDDIFVVDPRRVDYALAAEADPVDPIATERAAEMVEDDELEQLADLLEKQPDPDAVLERAVAKLDAEDSPRFAPPVTLAPAAVKAWGLEARAPLHFAHVNDVGAYKYKRKEHFRVYGYVLTQLEGGRPIKLQNVDLDDGTADDVLRLPEE